MGGPFVHLADVSVGSGKTGMTLAYSLLGKSATGSNWAHYS